VIDSVSSESESESKPGADNVLRARKKWFEIDSGTRIVLLPGGAE
jgi:hypothetical protein